MTDLNPQPPPEFPDELPDAIKLADLSTESLEALDHFGPEAPALLNNYAMKLEDALIEINNRNKELHKEVERLRQLLDKHNIDHSA